MTLVKQLRTWDEIPDDDAKAFHWLDLKTTEAADLIERQAAQIEMMRDAFSDKSLYCSSEFCSRELPENCCRMKQREALTTTPDEALEQFAAKVREQCDFECYRSNEYGFHRTYLDISNGIRAIKELPK